MRASTVLVVAQAQDVAADLAVDALLTHGATVERIDDDDAPRVLSPNAAADLIDGPGHLCAGKRLIDLSAVRGVYRRSPVRFAFGALTPVPEAQPTALESVFGLGGVLTDQPWRWIDRPNAVVEATVRPRQLSVAAECELRVPRSIVTNVADQVRAFAARVGALAYKPLSTGIVVNQDKARIGYTSRLEADDLDDEAITLCFPLLQEWIPKASDVRLTAVGHRCFAVAAHAGSPEAEIDWRSRHDDLHYEVCEPPADVRRGVQAYLREFGLTFGAFDFSVTPDGRWWFLECNPVGQWGWLAEETGLPIADAIATELMDAP
ncbi:MAG: hypothetical protein ACR2GH_04890 [Pseudonocardia sp.]